MTKSFDATSESIQELVDYISSILLSYKINTNLSHEYRILVEEIATKLIASAKDGATLTVDASMRLRGLNIKLSCRGKEVVLHQEDEYDLSGMIIDGFKDYLNQSYTAGVNVVTFSSSTTKFNRSLIFIFISILSSCVLARFLEINYSAEQLAFFDENIIQPVVQLFIKCLQALATPVAFFSLADFCVKLRQSFEQDKRLVRTSLRYFSLSLVALTIGFVLWTVYISNGISFDFANIDAPEISIADTNLKYFLESMIPSNIIEPFENSYPVSMLILSGILGIAAGNYYGREGESARHGLSSINGLFCNMLNLVYSTLPFFLFFAMLHGWISSGYSYYIRSAGNVLLFIPGFLILVLMYIAQLAIGGVNPIRFIADYKDVILENLKIGSNIDAMPYNKRMLHRRTRMSLDMLERELKLGTLMNMDGNCLMMSVAVVGLISYYNLKFTIPQLAIMIVTSILLSVGAPNQPGSFIICTIVLITVLGIEGDFYADFIVIEAILGRVYSCINSVADVVAMVVVNKTQQKKA